MIVAITEVHGPKLSLFVNVGEKTVWGKWVDRTDHKAVTDAVMAQHGILQNYAAEAGVQRKRSRG